MDKGSAHQTNRTIEILKRRYDALKSDGERVNCENHWQDIAHVVSPRKVDFQGMRTKGDKRMQRVYDPTGIHANELLAAGLHGLATNPASKWFSLRMIGKRYQDETGAWQDINELPDVQRYLSDVEEVMWQRLYQPGTNFTTALHEAYLDIGAFGTAILFVGQRENGGLMFEARSLAECVIAENSEGRIDTVYRVTEYTARQMWQMRKTRDNPDGWELSDHVRDLIDEQKFDDKIKVIHAVYPRAERDPTKRGSDNMPWASCYFEYESGHELEMSGFPEFPFLIARWSKYSNEVYGRSPAMTALPDIKMLQAMELAKVKLLQKAADPPMWLRDDGVVGGTRTIPGGINYWRGNPNDGVMLQPVSLAGIQALIQDQELIRQRILKTFYADIMRMTDDRAQMTATEVMQRTAEQMRLLGPLVGRLESEMLGPLVERVFGILGRMGILPKAPEIIQGEEFSVEYVSPIATAQKQTSLNSIAQALQFPMMFGEEMAAKVIMKNVNIDKLFRHVWDILNNDPDLLQDEAAQQQMAQMEQAQQALPMAQQVMQMMAQGGQAVKAGAGAVKDLGAAQAEGGIDLNALIQGVQNGASNWKDGAKGAARTARDMQETGGEIMDGAY
jgi:hypothetical protein